MQLPKLIEVFAVLAVGFFAFASTRPSYGILEEKGELPRWKRQSHPDATVARFPPLVEAGLAEEVRGKEGEEIGNDGAFLEEPLPYLTPPVPEGGVSQRTGAVADGERWDLGWEAGDLLVPPLPESHPGPYETMKEKDVVSTQSLNGEQEPAASASDDTYRPTLGRRYPNQFLSFVKTDKEGHFKWGVRQEGE